MLKYLKQYTMMACCVVWTLYMVMAKETIHPAFAWFICTCIAIIILLDITELVQSLQRKRKGR